MTKKAVGDVNASQLVGMFGPGSIVNLESVSVMPEAPVNWPAYDRTISSPTFARQIGARELIDCGAMASSYVPSRIFPTTFVCHKCGSIRRERILSSDQLSHGLRCSTADKERMHPSRWVVFCLRGHIDDFDYDRFVHARSKCDDPHVQLLTRDTVAATRVSCLHCGANRSLQEAYAWVRSGKCSANRPWEGRRDEDCDAEPKLSMRSASDVYFGAIRSAISIEPETKRSVRTVFEILSKSKVITREDALYFLKFSKAADEFASEDLEIAVDAYLQAQEDPGRYEDRRFQEYSALRTESGGPTEDLWAELIPESGLSFAGISNVLGVRKLREVRALYGFQRGSIPPDPTFEQAVSELSVRFREVLPAYENRGEGIFFDFDTKQLSEWLDRTSVKENIDRFMHAERRWITDTSRGGEAVGRGLYVLAHSFAHLVMRQLALECGYSQAALRERIFASPDDSDRPWAGVLIYTSSSDADGSLGGLVFQALDRRLPKIIRRGYRDLMICSSDPVCALQEPKGFRKLNAAACHSCLVLPETSCERNNTFLDRNIVVPGTLRDPQNALYFGAT